MTTAISSTTGFTDVSSVHDANTVCVGPEGAKIHGNATAEDPSTKGDAGHRWYGMPWLGGNEGDDDRGDDDAALRNDSGKKGHCLRLLPLLLLLLLCVCEALQLLCSILVFSCDYRVVFCGVSTMRRKICWRYLEPVHKRKFGMGHPVRIVQIMRLMA